MCSIIIAFQEFENKPLIVAANREEQYDRPAEPPIVREDNIRYLAPRDRKAGGTWIGCNESNLIIALSNRVEGPLGDTSRGNLVTALLNKQSAKEAVNEVRQAISTTTYAGFNLLIADRGKAVACSWSGEWKEAGLRRGIHTIVNGGRGNQTTKSAIIEARLRSHDFTSAHEWIERAKAILEDHGNRVCVHGESRGTRSSSVITLSAKGEINYEFADGPPCTHAYRSIVEGEL